MRRPRLVAEQARHAKGVLGWIIAFIMARETWATNLQAIGALEIKPGDHVLDLGCGHGRGLADIVARAPGVRVTGVDPSALMVRIAGRRNRRLIRASKAEVLVASAESLPFADGAFDRILCVHVVYFWPDVDIVLSEIGRVLKPGGRLAMVFRTEDDTAAVQAFPPEVYRFPALSRMVDALGSAGLSTLSAEASGPGDGPILLIAERSAESA